MNIKQTEVLVIGGGATGTGIVRDLAMRGFKAILLEKRDYTHGTTGRYHGVLHSGGRYVVKDPEAARECIEENRILREIMPHCIEDTGGFFVLTPEDDLDYVHRFQQGCRNVGIPCEEISISQMLKSEPLLDPKIDRCFRVPDASADSFLAAQANIDAAKQYGAITFNYHDVKKILINNGKVIGALCHNLVLDEEIQILADIVINATGAWVGKIASTVGISIKMTPGKGVMVAANHRLVNTIINRCKMPSDGNILVPAHTVTVMGTTDVKVEDPDHFSIEPWEVKLLLDEGDKLIPGFSNMRMVRAWAGVRPLYQEESSSANRDITRAFVLLDHAERDGIEAFITITSGKWTTYRKMAQETVDLVCEKLGVERTCRTHLEIITGGEDHKYHHLGHRLELIERNQQYNQLICECELATKADIQKAIISDNAHTLDDIRRDIRLGMGPCQGGFCTIRAAGIMHSLRECNPLQTNTAIKDFLQERWKGVQPVLWGQQLQQARFTEFIYRYILNVDHLPSLADSKLKPELYNPPLQRETELENNYRPKIFETQSKKQTHPKPKIDVLIIGGGLAGLYAAFLLAYKGLKVQVACKGWGATHWHTGCIDILGYLPNDYTHPIKDLNQAIHLIISTKPQHPYSLVGENNIHLALDAFKGICNKFNYPLIGDIEHNWLLPTAVGSVHPTCLVPETMIAGNLELKEPILLIGIDGYHDFYPQLIADNLVHQGIQASCLNLTIKEICERSTLTSRTLASLFDQEVFLEKFTEILIKEIRHNIEIQYSRIGLPAVLGLQNPIRNHRYLCERLGVPIFEIPALPPSIPGIRLQQILVKGIEENGGQVYDGMEIIGHFADEQNVKIVYSEAASRNMEHRASNFILATGGILGGGISSLPLRYPHEIIFDFPLENRADQPDLFSREFLSQTGHSIFSCGVEVNKNFLPINSKKQTIYKNLYAIGNILGWCDGVLERSLDGIAITTAYTIANQLKKSYL